MSSRALTKSMLSLSREMDQGMPNVYVTSTPDMVGVIVNKKSNIVIFHPPYMPGVTKHFFRCSADVRINELIWEKTCEDK